MNDRVTPKDWGHTCGECKWFDMQYQICYKHENEFPHECFESDREACSDFIPRKGWQE